MLLHEIAQPNVPVFHTTNVSAAISILQTRQFKLFKGGEDGSDGEGEDPTDMYHLSVGRSTQTEFNSMMLGPGAVILVINKARLQNNNKVVPYQSANAAQELSHYGHGEGDEMEDRVYGTKPILPIRGPLNNTILQVRIMGQDSHKARGSMGARVDYTTAQHAQLMQLCKQNNIPFLRWSTDDEETFKMGRRGQPVG